MVYLTYLDPCGAGTKTRTTECSGDFQGQTAAGFHNVLLPLADKPPTLELWCYLMGSGGPLSPQDVSDPPHRTRARPGSARPRTAQPPPPACRLVDFHTSARTVSLLLWRKSPLSHITQLTLRPPSLASWAGFKFALSSGQRTQIQCHRCQSVEEDRTACDGRSYPGPQESLGHTVSK